MYNDCAVEMEPEYVGNHEDLKVQAPWGHLQTKSCFCYYKLLFLYSKQINFRLMHLQTLSHIPFITAPPWATPEWHPWLHPNSLHLCPWERPCPVVQLPLGRGQLEEWEPQWNYPLCFFFNRAGLMPGKWQPAAVRRTMRKTRSRGKCIQITPNKRYFEHSARPLSAIH